MKLKEKRDFCWAARHSMMDLVALENFTVKDKMATLEVIENLSDNKLIEMTLDILHADDTTAGMILDTIVVESHKEANPELSIQNESKFYRYRDSFLLEASGEKDEFPTELTKAIMVGSLPAAAALVTQQAMRQGTKKTKLQLKIVMRSLAATNGKAYNMLASIPIVRKLVPGSFVTVTQAGKKLKVPRYVAGKLDRSVAGSQTAIGAASQKVSGAAKWTGEKMASIERGPSKLTRKIINRTGAVSLGVGAASLLAYGIYKRITDPARKSCSKVSGKQKTACILKYKIQAATAAISSLEKGMVGCDEKSDPEKCRYSFQKQIWHWNKRKSKYEDKLAKLAHGKSQFRTHNKLR